jgi:hypothetical protein
MSSIVNAIKERYSSIADSVNQLNTNTNPTSCCRNSSALTKERLDPITRDNYSAQEEAKLPPKAIQVSLGCGNPTAMVTLKEGQTVLDLGSGNYPLSQDF